MNSKEKALCAALAAHDKLATDIVVLYVKEVFEQTDYFVICTAANRPRMQAILENIEDHLRLDANCKPIAREGYDKADWSLIDYGDFIVHVFSPELRDFYRLDAMWRRGEIIALEEGGIEDAEFTSEYVTEFVKEAFEKKMAAAQEAK